MKQIELLEARIVDLFERCPTPVLFEGFYLVRSESDNKWHAFKVHGSPAIASSTSFTTCVEMAEESIAAERDAKKSQREKRLECVVKRLLQQRKDYNHGQYFLDVHYEELENALKED